MNQLKKILLKLHGENKSKLRWLYVDKQIYIASVCSSEQPIEDERVFRYHELSFRFTGTGMRHPERMNLLVYIPQETVDAGDTSPHLPQGTTSSFPQGMASDLPQETAFSFPQGMASVIPQETASVIPREMTSVIPREDYLLRILSPEIARLSLGLENDHKDSREKASFECQTVNECILRRNGLVYNPEKKAYVLRILFRMPLINGTGINAKSGLKALRDILESIELTLKNLDREMLKTHIQTYRRQMEIQDWLLSHDKVAFIADGSILPRQGEQTAPNGNTVPMEGAVPFASPSDLQETLILSDGFRLTGMALPKGVTVITGGGYSGKSTLLNALENGIYHHIPGDGREYVISLTDSTKIYAEDGRPVHCMDLSCFFREQSPELSFRRFSTAHASGSVSQAANTLEAVYAGCRLLLIDEDTSATNFMIRDPLIRRLVTKEPIIPFTDRVRPLYSQTGISTVLVIGGSGEYLPHADLCLLMEDYTPRNVTALVRELTKAVPSETQEDVLPLPEHRLFKCPESAQPFHISQCVSVDNAHYIQIDDYTSDVTRLTSLVSLGQFHTLAWLLERFLSLPAGSVHECRLLASRLTSLIFEPEIIDRVQEESCLFTLWLEEIRPADLLAALFRMRGIQVIPAGDEP